MSERVKYLKKIIRVRKKLIQLNQSRLNQHEVLTNIREIEKYVQAYGDKYGEDYWKGFMNRRKSEILYLIPANRAEDAYLKELNELL